MPDPNGIAWDDWKAAGYASYEAWIESKAGANPPEPYRLIEVTPTNTNYGPFLPSDWPFPRVDVAGDEDQETPTP